ncbi:MAG TPA: flagellar biosynthetic protein FliR [Kofleriaceae bacterium]
MSLTPAEIGAFLVAFVRVAAVAFTAPVIGDQGVPVRARLVFCVSVAIALAANRPGVEPADVPVTAIVELGSGIITGLTARFVMARLANAGQLMGLALGLGFASQFDVHAGENAGVVRTLAATLGSLAFLAAHGLEAIVRSVATPASGLGMLMQTNDLLRQGTASFGYGLSLAAPIMLAALVGNLGIAVMNRAAPAVNVFSVALGAVLILGLALMIGSAGGFVASAIDVARDSTYVLAPR